MPQLEFFSGYGSDKHTQGTHRTTGSIVKKAKRIWEKKKNCRNGTQNETQKRTTKGIHGDISRIQDIDKENKKITTFSCHNF